MKSAISWLDRCVWGLHGLEGNGLMIRLAEEVGIKEGYRPTWHGNSAMDISAAVRDLMPMSLLLWLDPTHATASRTAMDGDSETQNHSRHGPNDVPSKGLPRTPLRTRGGSSSRLDMKRSS